MCRIQNICTGLKVAQNKEFERLYKKYELKGILLTSTLHYNPDTTITTTTSSSSSPPSTTFGV